jgi:hypothetical protein
MGLQQNYQNNVALSIWNLAGQYGAAIQLDSTLSGGNQWRWVSGGTPDSLIGAGSIGAFDVQQVAYEWYLTPTGWEYPKSGIVAPTADINTGNAGSLTVTNAAIVAALAQTNGLGTVYVTNYSTSFAAATVEPGSGDMAGAVYLSFNGTNTAGGGSNWLQVIFGKNEGTNYKVLQSISYESNTPASTTLSADPYPWAFSATNYTATGFSFANNTANPLGSSWSAKTIKLSWAVFRAQ